MSKNRPAFPAIQIRPGDNYNPAMKIYHTGVTTRDYFAAKALQGLLAAGERGDEEAIADSAYKMADAMIKASMETK